MGKLYCMCVYVIYIYIYIYLTARKIGSTDTQDLWILSLG